MIEGLFIKTNTGLQFADPETENRFNQYGNGELIPVQAKIKYDPRSYEQLGLFWAVTKLVSEQTDDKDWNTSDKVHDQCLIDQKLYDHFIHYENKKTGEIALNIKLKSIAFKNMSHLEACNFFDAAFEFMAEKIGLDKDDLINEAKSRMKRKV